jgi:hypothetical protein
MTQFKTHSVHIISNINRTELNEKDSLNISVNVTVVPFKNFALLNSRVGAGAGVA